MRLSILSRLIFDSELWEIKFVERMRKDEKVVCDRKSGPGAWGRTLCKARLEPRPSKRRPQSHVQTQSVAVSQPHFLFTRGSAARETPTTRCLDKLKRELEKEIDWEANEAGGGGGDGGTGRPPALDAPDAAPERRSPADT